MKNLLAGLAILLLATLPAKAQTVDREFKLLSGGFVVSSFYDAETTVQGIKSGMAHEANPIARPFVGNGDRGGTYGFALATDAAVIGAAYALKKRGRPWRWPLIIGTTAHVIAGSANLRFVF